ncbi:hypothetical protein M8J75_001039 [Diaphorina citri]|nr:hypothetical protein M8J75_001039 [Diaphorina citri]
MFSPKLIVGNLVSPKGWPFCLNRNAVVINLLEIESTLLRNRDFYLFLKINERTKSCLLHLSYKLHDRIVTRQISKYDSIMSVLDLASYPVRSMEESQDYAVEDLCNVDLVNDLCSLITSVDHAIERVALDDLAFPCISCQQCILQSTDEDNAKCECGPSRNDNRTKIDISQSHESIPHIDSDEESIPDNDKSVMGARKLDDFKSPTSISEIPENLLMSGIHFPGIHDTSGRSVIVYDAATVAKSCLDPADIGKVILYYVSLPVRPERTKHGVTLLVLSGLPGDSTYDHLDRALLFLESKVHIASLLVWRKISSGPRVTEAHRQRLQRSNSNVLPNSKIEYHVLDDIDGLRHFLDEEQTPAECGGPTSHDQLEWVEFYKEYEPFLSQCHSCGRSLVTTLSDIRDVTASHDPDDVTTNRRSLVASHRAINRVLSDAALCKLRRDGHRTLTQLEERAHWLPYSEDVKICVERADRLFAEVERGAKRLEQLCQKRKEKIREQQRLKALHTETTEVLSWLKSKGATTLKRHASLASTLPALKAQEQDFEKFYFISMPPLIRVIRIRMDDLNCKLLSVKIYDRDSGLDSYSRVSSSSLDCSSSSSLSCRVRRLRDNVRVTRRRSAMLRASSVPVIRVMAPYIYGTL